MKHLLFINKLLIIILPCHLCVFYVYICSLGGGHRMGTVVRERWIRTRLAKSAIASDCGEWLSELVQERRLRSIRQSVCGMRRRNVGLRGGFLSSTHILQLDIIILYYVVSLADGPNIIILYYKSHWWIL